MTDPLPPALAPWTGALTVLTPAFTLALGPLLRGLDELVRGREPRPGADGEPDGYDGLSRRGVPQRLLASQWLLADELPDEFLRRAVQRELLHLAPARRDGRPRGRIVVVADTGPSTAGAARLVQLAALVVLSRRAEAHRSELILRIPAADIAGSGPLARLLPVWLRARCAEDPQPADLAGVADAEPEDTEVWILTSEHVGAGLRGRRRVVTATESAWDAEGAAAVRIMLDGSRVELPLPPGPVALSALRGRQFCMARGRSADAGEPVRVRLPSFTGDSPHVLLRGPDPETVATLNLGAVAPGWKHHVFPAPVVAASFLGRRLVVVLAGDPITIGCVGRGLPAADRITVPRSAVGLTDALLTQAAGDPLGCVFYDTRRFLVRLGRRWWSLRPGEATATDYVAVVPRGPAGAVPPIRIEGAPGENPHRRFACLDHRALAVGDGAWLIRGPRVRQLMRLPEDDRVLGLVLTPTGPALISFAEGENLIRATFLGGARGTVMEWDDPGLLPAVHPTRPLAAGIRDGRLHVVDAATGNHVLTRAVIV